MGIKRPQAYRGFEQGPIRPPSEAASLLIRVTRNCPWNRCTFCSVYKGQAFELRPVDHVLADIDALAEVTDTLLDALHRQGELTPSGIQQIAADRFADRLPVFQSAFNWLARGEGSVFLQDANSLILRPEDLTRILRHLRARFPFVTRITSYARSHSIVRISDAEMQGLADAGLNRIHIGLESGCDEVLERTCKGATKADHIAAGRRVRRAGIELSEYVMPGLGGRELAESHAWHTADALNQIDADFIRLRTLTIPPGIPLYDDWVEGRFQKCTDLEIIREIRAFIGALDGISSTLKSDHFHNLLQDVEGRLPEDKPRMLALLDEYLGLPAQEQALFQLGRRLGFFQGLGDLAPGPQRAGAESLRQRLAVTPDNVERIIERHRVNSL